MYAEQFREILETVSAGGSAELLIEAEGERYVRRFEAPERLIILGGGHIALPLCRMATMLDFSVTVVDDRPSFANAARFPEAAEVLCLPFAEAIARLRLTGSDYVCIVTRGHRWDAVCLREILMGTLPSYLGMIGSKKRVGGVRDMLAAEGFDPAALDRLHAPIGLPIRAQTPAEIALSICAEMIAHKRADAEHGGPSLLEQRSTDPALLDYLASGREPRALLMVIDSTGSTPMKSGAMMAVNTLGQGRGSIGGGCGEAAAMAQARRLIGTGRSKLLELDMDNDAAASEGMVCGGHMWVWIDDITG